MNAENICPKCQRTLPTDGPRGLCPACLLAVGLSIPANQDDLLLTPAPTIPAGKQLPPPTASDLAPLFPQLEIIEILGQGGMGTVYKAKQKKLDRLVALKIVRSDAAADPAFAERFNREARTLARMNHPNIVAVHDFGEVPMRSKDSGDSQPLYYFVMEFVDGANLRQLMNGQRLEVQQALAIVPQVCEALQYAHDEGVVHRDIKPENILIDHRGRVKIADFGLAKLVAGSSDDFTLTGTHQVMGTPRYMAPEQMEGSHAVDHRADIYSLGVVFYEMLTGQVPAGHFDPPSHKADVDFRLDSIVLKAMARDPDRRFQRASDVRTEVESVGASPKMRSEKKTVDRIDVADAPHRASPQTVSEFLSYEAAAAAGWFAGTPQSAKRIPLTIRWLAPLLCVAPDLSPFQLASRLLTVIGVVLLLVAVVGGFLGMFTATVVTSQAQLENTRRIGEMILAFLVANVILGTFAFVSGRLIRRGEWINMSRFVCVMVILIGNVTLPVTAPLAIWCLVVLSRIRQNYDFKTGKMTLSIVDGDTPVTVNHR